MDKLSLIGLLLGILAILGGQFLEGGHLSSLLQPTAFIIVVGGTMAAITLQTPASVFLSGLKMAWWVFRRPAIDSQSFILDMMQWSQISRRDGMLSLEKFIEKSDSDFVRKALQMLVDGTEVEQLRTVLEIDIEQYEQTLRQSARIWESAGGYSPTLGILGAVMGLIQVMENLTDPGKLGAGIAVAFVATIYGVGLANLLYLPIYGKLRFHIEQFVNQREMLLEGFIGIAQGHNPRLIEARMKGFIRP